MSFRMFVSKIPQEESRQVYTLYDLEVQIHEFFHITGASVFDLKKIFKIL